MGHARTFGVVLGIGVIMAAPAAVVAMGQSKPPTTVVPFPTTSTTVSGAPVYFPGPPSEVTLTGVAACVGGGSWMVTWTVGTPHPISTVVAVMSDVKVSPIINSETWMTTKQMIATYPPEDRSVKMWVKMQWLGPLGNGMSDGVVVVNPCGK